MTCKDCVHNEEHKKIMQTVRYQAEELKRRDKLIIELEKEIDKVTAERNAAVQDLKILKVCDTCVFNNPDFEYPFVDCVCPSGCRDGSEWKWRGIHTGGAE